MKKEFLNGNGEKDVKPAANNVNVESKVNKNKNDGKNKKVVINAAAEKEAADRIANRKRSAPMAFGPMGGMGMGGKAKNFKKSMGTLITYLKKSLPAIIIALVLAIGSTVLSILMPRKLGNISSKIQFAVKYAAATGEKLNIDLPAIAKIGFILIIFIITAAIANYIQTLIMTDVTQKMAKRMRSEINGKIARLPLKYFDTVSHGEVLSRVTNDVDTVGQSINQSVVTLITSVIMIAGLLIMMFITSWQLALVVLVTVPISFALVLIIVKFSQKHFRGFQYALGEVLGHVEETYSGHEVLIAYGGEDMAKEKFGIINNKLYNNAWKSNFFNGLIMPIMGFINNLGLVAVCVTGALLYINGKIDNVGVIVEFVFYANLFTHPVNQLAQVTGSLQSAAAAAERVFEFLSAEEMPAEEIPVKEIPEEVHLNGRTQEDTTVKGLVEFKHVKFGYTEDRLVIKDFSMTALPGQKVAIVGPTGAGKTTLVNLLMRFYECDGDITVDGVSIKDMTRNKVHSLFGMVLQDTWMFEGTIKDNISFSTPATDEEIVTVCEAVGIDHFIRTLSGGYNMAVDENCNISTGQRQLITIARAMIENAPMLILDEATSSVDTRTERLLQAAMDKLTEGRTSFIIAHRLSTIKNADLILVMNDGDVIEQGTHDSLISKNGFYSKLYNSQFENA